MQIISTPAYSNTQNCVKYASTTGAIKITLKQNCMTIWMHTLLKGNVHVFVVVVYLHKEHECIVYYKRYERVSKCIERLAISISISSYIDFHLYK